MPWSRPFPAKTPWGFSARGKSSQPSPGLLRPLLSGGIPTGQFFHLHRGSVPGVPSHVRQGNEPKPRDVEEPGPGLASPPRRKELGVISSGCCTRRSPSSSGAGTGLAGVGVEGGRPLMKLWTRRGCIKLLWAALGPPDVAGEPRPHQNPRGEQLAARPARSLWKQVEAARDKCWQTDLETHNHHQLSLQPQV